MVMSRRQEIQAARAARAAEREEAERMAVLKEELSLEKAKRMVKINDARTIFEEKFGILEMYELKNRREALDDEIANLSNRSLDKDGDYVWDGPSKLSDNICGIDMSERAKKVDKMIRHCVKKLKRKIKKVEKEELVLQEKTETTLANEDDNMVKKVEKEELVLQEKTETTLANEDDNMVDNVSKERSDLMFKLVDMLEENLPGRDAMVAAKKVREDALESADDRVLRMPSDENAIYEQNIHEERTYVLANDGSQVEIEDFYDGLVTDIRELTLLDRDQYKFFDDWKSEWQSLDEKLAALHDSYCPQSAGYTLLYELDEKMPKEWQTFCETITDVRPASDIAGNMEYDFLRFMGVPDYSVCKAFEDCMLTL